MIIKANHFYMSTSLMHVLLQLMQMFHKGMINHNGLRHIYDHMTLVWQFGEILFNAWIVRENRSVFNSKMIMIFPIVFYYNIGFKKRSKRNAISQVRNEFC